MINNEDVGRLVEVMLGEEDLRSLCRELLKALLHHTGSQIAAVYLLDEQKISFQRFESIGLSAAGRASFSADGNEGEFGAVLATRQIQRVSDVPEDTLRDIPGIELAASAMEGNRDDVLAYGFDGYIAKPIEKQAFLETIWEKLHAVE